MKSHNADPSASLIIKFHSKVPYGSRIAPHKVSQWSLIAKFKNEVPYKRPILKSHNTVSSASLIIKSYDTVSTWIHSEPCRAGAACKNAYVKNPAWARIPCKNAYPQALQDPGPAQKCISLVWSIFNLYWSIRNFGSIQSQFGAIHSQFWLDPFAIWTDVLHIQDCLGWGARQLRIAAHSDE
jgi:hypothetical protein